MSGAEYTRGRFVWHDLMTRDPGRAGAFYSELFGWRVQELDMGPMGKYKMLMNGPRQEDGVGGIMPLDGAPAEIPNHWINYIGVVNVDEACKVAAEHGGKVCVPPFDIPNVGRTAVLEDPSGAVFSPFRGSDDRGERPSERPKPGQFCWFENLCEKPEANRKFYSALFGWNWRDSQIPGIEYWLADRDEKGNRIETCGLMKKQPQVPASYWQSYVAVADIKASTARAKTLGANLLHEDRIPGVGSFSIFLDPTGAAIALYEGEQK